MKNPCKLHKFENHKSHMKAMRKSDCPYCAESEDDRDNCKYCQELDSKDNADGEAGMDDCDMCRDYESGEDDCPYCQDGQDESEQESAQESAQGHICNCPNCQNNAEPEQEPLHPDNCEQCQKMFAGATENEPGQTGQEDPNLQGHETAEEVLDLLDQEPGKGSTPKQESEQIDDTELPQGQQMQDGASINEDFGDTQQEDKPDEQLDGEGHGCNCPSCPKQSEMNESEQVPQEQQEPESDEPNVAGVLKQGLDEHADSQNRARVVDLVAQTLQGFKANKQYLDQAKEQAPEFYQSNIQMLRAMIELCRLLGLEPKIPQEQEQSDQQSGQMSEQAPEGQPDPKAVG